jgi:hypothetical protein
MEPPWIPETPPVSDYPIYIVLYKKPRAWPAPPVTYSIALHPLTHLFLFTAASARLATPVTYSRVTSTRRRDDGRRRGSNLHPSSVHLHSSPLVRPGGHLAQRPPLLLLQDLDSAHAGEPPRTGAGLVLLRFYFNWRLDDDRATAGRLHQLGADLPVESPMGVGYPVVSGMGGVLSPVA